MRSIYSFYYRDSFNDKTRVKDRANKGTANERVGLISSCHFLSLYLFAPIKRKDDREDGGIQRIEATKWKKEERLDFEIELYENNLASKIAKQSDTFPSFYA